MPIRTATPADLGRILDVYASARAYMAATDNATQWGDTYPEQEVVAADIAAGHCFVGVDERGAGRTGADGTSGKERALDETGTDRARAGNQGGTERDAATTSATASATDEKAADKTGTIHFVFALLEGNDPTYVAIEQGDWANDDPYLTIHRVASDGARHGIVGEIMRFAKAQAARRGIRSIRIDTHENNLTMQHALERQGFKRRGVIHLENGDPRWAYQLVW